MEQGIALREYGMEKGSNGGRALGKAGRGEFKREKDSLLGMTRPAPKARGDEPFVVCLAFFGSSPG
jgi:hypothetical protein